ncbi:MAG: TROVE domain-containing protein [Bryobacteraceae bacterium]
MFRLETFLILGGDPGAYRASQYAFHADACGPVREALRTDGPAAVRLIEQVAEGGKALSPDAALYALALASSPQFASPETNAAALHALPRVARSGAQLCKYAAYVGTLRGWGRGLRSAVADWYTSKPIQELATQILKHRHRKGWSHRDLLRLSHPKPPTPEHNALFQWAVEGELGHLATPNIASGNLRQIYAFEQLKKTTDEIEMVRLVEDFQMTHDTIPPLCRKSAAVWEALLGSIPYMAMVRNLGHMTEAGLIAPQSAATALVVMRLVDRGRIRRANVQPAALLSALAKYRSGPWQASSVVAGALEDALHLAFSNVESTGQRIFFGIDASLLAKDARCHGMSHVPAAQAAATLAMEFARVDSRSHIALLDREPDFLDITKTAKLQQVVGAVTSESQAADPSTAIAHATENQMHVDAFVFFSSHVPLNALEVYRERTGIPAKLVIVTSEATDFEGAVPEYVMRVAGFEPAVPRAVRQFITMNRPVAVA